MTVNPWWLVLSVLLTWVNGYLTGCILTNRRYLKRFQEMTAKFNRLTSEAADIRARLANVSKGRIQ